MRLLVFTALAAGCGAPALAPDREPPARETRVVPELAQRREQVPPPAVLAPAATPPAPPPPSPLDALKARLAARWCAARLGFPSGIEPPDCSRTEARVSERRDGELESSVIVLVADGSEAQYLWLHAGDASAVFALASAWSSGVGGFSHEITLDHTEVSDVTGDALPEWRAEVTVESHDSDMGECHVSGSVERKLVLCSRQKEGFACAALPLESSRYDEIYAEDPPNPACARPRLRNTGFALGAFVERDRVTLRALAPTSLERRFTAPQRAPLAGKLEISGLLARAGLRLQALAELP